MVCKDPKKIVTFRVDPPVMAELNRRCPKGLRNTCLENMLLATLEFLRAGEDDNNQIDLIKGKITVYSSTFVNREET